ncbi:hypothetical protein B0T14DRAFT_517086 [Immersiella caudata]|uniref:Secreted protein n=1 Tax=Immersiella caudata TaxID=314043 RepID=A0AA40C3V6_9PEZI|nr:hypothetical protein B0T14DRAFT_517086 [Immersiella caudata]
MFLALNFTACLTVSISLGLRNPRFLRDRKAPFASVTSAKRTLHWVPATSEAKTSRRKVLAIRGHSLQQRMNLSTRETCLSAQLWSFKDHISVLISTLCPTVQEIFDSDERICCHTKNCQNASPDNGHVAPERRLSILFNGRATWKLENQAARQSMVRRLPGI